jgi:hypothetical protein
MELLDLRQVWAISGISCADLKQVMNEPHRGYIDLPSLHQFDYNTDLHLSHVRACT